MDERVKIDSITVRRLELPFRSPYRVSSGVLHFRRSLVVEIREDGAVGYGESAPCEEPFYSEETLGTVRTLYEELFLPRLVGREFPSISAFDQAIREGVRGNPFARAGLENAYWDLCCLKNGIPLVGAVGRRLAGMGLAKGHLTPRRGIPSGVALGIPEDGAPDTLARSIESHLEAGYRRVKIKIRPGWDVEACRAARRAAGDDMPLWTDANAAFDIERHLETFRAMDDFGLLFHEQPLDHRDLLEHRALGREISTPICLDESLASFRAARDTVRLKASRIWNIKVQRVGGLCEAIEIYRLAAANDILLWGGTMPESGIGAQAILALAAFPAFVYPSDVEPSTRWYGEGHDPLELVMTPDGEVPLSRQAGIETALDKERYHRFSRVLMERRSRPS